VVLHRDRLLPQGLLEAAARLVELELQRLASPGRLLEPLLDASLLGHGRGQLLPSLVRNCHLPDLSF